MTKLHNSNQPQTTDFAPGHFAGNYTTAGEQYYQNNSNNLLIKVCERKQPTAIKPRKYVMHRTTDGKFHFLTSLYPTNDQDTIYIAEIARCYFTVVMDTDSLTVTVKPKPL